MCIHFIINTQKSSVFSLLSKTLKSLPLKLTCKIKSKQLICQLQFQVKESYTAQNSLELNSPPGPPHHSMQNKELSHTHQETRAERDTCSPMLIAALFIIARTWKEPKCPSADDWVRKLWYRDTKKYYSAIKKDTFESVLMRWMKLEPIIQSEVSQKEKHQYSILMHMYGI